jgi:hypothetical protein
MPEPAALAIEQPAARVLCCPAQVCGGLSALLAPASAAAPQAAAHHGTRYMSTQQSCRPAQQHLQEAPCAGDADDQGSTPTPSSVRMIKGCASPT